MLLIYGLEVIVKVHKIPISPVVILLILISLSLACQLSGLISGSDTPSQEIETSVSEEEIIEEVVIVPDVEAGFSRQNPIPFNTLVSVPGWDIQVLEFLRGEAAAAVVNSGSRQFDPPPAGFEYALANVFFALHGNR